MNAFIVSKKVFSKALKFYLPIHMLPVIIFKRSRLMKEPLQVIKKLVKNIFMSCLFLTLYVSVFWYFFCRFKNYRKKSDMWNIIYASMIGSWSIIFEQ